MHGRRKMLVGCGGVLTTVVLSGCSFLDGDGEDAFDFGPYSDYREWLPAVDSGPVNVFAANPADIVDFEVIEGEGEGGEGGGIDRGIFGVPTGRIAHLVNFSIGEAVDESASEVLIAVGEYDVSTAREGFEADQGVSTEPDGEFDEYDVFAAGGAAANFSVFGAKSEVAIAASDRDLFERVVETEADSHDALIEQHRELELAADLIDNRDWMHYSVNFEDEIHHPRVVRATAFDLFETDSEFLEVSVYTDESAAQEEESLALEDWEAKPGTTDVETDLEGRVLVVSGTQATEEVL